LLGSLTELRYLDLGSNSLSGSVPRSFSNLVLLQHLLLANNSLTSFLLDSPPTSFENLQVPTSFTNLNVVDLSNNAFSGSLSPYFFLLPKLDTFASSANCFNGTLPQSICNATKLKSLSLDGLSSGMSCKRLLWSTGLRNGPLHFDAMQSKHLMKGSVPACVFNLPNLVTLHLSANGFTGTLPQIASRYSPLLDDFSIAFNRLGGSVPDFLLQKGMQRLDLSHNKLKGSLVQHVVYNQNTTKIALSVNRLSGLAPYTLHDAPNSVGVDILRGNMFECPRGAAADLPLNDKYYNKYSCGLGSADFAEVYYAMIAVHFFLLLVIALAIYSARKRTLNEEGKLVYIYQGMTPSWCLDSLFVLSFNLLEWKRFVTAHFASCSIPDEFQHLSRVIALLEHVRSFVLRLYFPILFFLFLMYPIWSSTNGVLEQDYAWAFTAAYKSGVAPAFCFLIIWSTVLSSCFFFMSKKSLEQEDEAAAAATAIAAVEDEDELADPSHSPSSALVFVRLLLLILIDVFAVLPANILFVIYLTQEKVPTKFQDEITLAYVIFKLTWNAIVVPFMTMSKPLPLGTRNQNNNRTRSALAQVRLRTLLLVFNNIVAPCIATAVSDSRCFDAAFQAPPSITSSYNYEYCSIYNLTDYCTLHTHPSVPVTTNPPFDYYWQCSSALVTNYSPVFVLMAILSLANIGVTCLARLTVTFCFAPSPTTTTEEDERASTADNIPLFTDATSFSSWLRRWCACWRWTSEQRRALLLLLVHPLLRSKNERQLVCAMGLSAGAGRDLRSFSITSSNSNSTRLGTSTSSDLRGQMENFIVTPVVNIFMLLTFGVVNPLLGLVLLLSVCASTLWQQVLMGRFVTLALRGNSKGKLLVLELENACARIARDTFQDVASYALVVSSTFLCFFLYDMAGDVQGVVTGIWAPIAFLLVMLCVWAVETKRVTLWQQLGLGQKMRQHQLRQRQRQRPGNSTSTTTNVTLLTVPSPLFPSQSSPPPSTLPTPPPPPPNTNTDLELATITRGPIAIPV